MKKRPVPDLLTELVKLEIEKEIFQKEEALLGVLSNLAWCSPDFRDLLVAEYQDVDGTDLTVEEDLDAIQRLTGALRRITKKNREAAATDKAS